MLKKIRDVQKSLKEQNIDGWLLYDFRRSNDLACQFLEISPEKLLTRRFLYWIPQSGSPVKIVHAIEQNHLDHLPGEKVTYRSWQELEAKIAEVLQGKKQIAMEYSPRNANPYVSKVDGGTIEIIRDCGTAIVSSADLLQKFTSVWTPQQLTSHYYAAKVLDETAAQTWAFIGDSLKVKKRITEYDVQQFILSEITAQHCMMDGLPICAVNAHSADPHYTPTEGTAVQIHPEDFILIDLWCKQKLPQAVYADITRVGVASSAATEKQNQLFHLVKKAQDAGVALVKKRFADNQPLLGWEVDQACRNVITKGGFEEYFIHRTGHNIGIHDHGDGAHLDNLETQDRRQIIPGTCFSIEPGIYLPGEFGVRLEFDVYVHQDGRVEVTGGIQEQIELIR